MDRDRYVRSVAAAFRTFPVVAVLGPRQCGKTTLAGMCAVPSRRRPVSRFDLEDPTDLARLAEPKLALEDLRGLVVIDEVQARRGCLRSSGCSRTGPTIRPVS